MLSENNSKIILSRVRLGDHAAFKELYNNYAESMLDYSMSITCDRQYAKDVVQEIFVIIWRNKEKLKPEMNIKMYLFKAVRNNSIKLLQSNKTKGSLNKEVESIPYDTIPLDNLQEKELHDAYKEALLSLPRKCKEIFMLNRYSRFTYAEIADVQEISINTVKTQMKRALRTLKSKLSHFLDPEIFTL
ncbi:RNA polymerase sigma factor [candidate division KSB1 bacterium]